MLILPLFFFLNIHENEIIWSHRDQIFHFHTILKKGIKEEEGSSRTPGIPYRSATALVSFLLHISPLLGSSGSVNHLNIGGGIPMGLQTRVTCSPTALDTTLTGSTNDGGAEIDGLKDIHYT